MNPRVETKSWKLKVDDVNDILKDAIKETIRKNHDRIRMSITRYVEGVHLGEKFRGYHSDIGKVPIPRRTGNLSRSVQTSTPEFWVAVFKSLNEVAPYNKIVHDGLVGTNRRPRKFIDDSVTLWSGQIMDDFEKVIESVRKVGQR